MLNPDDAKTVDTVVGELVRMRRTFTGKDVMDRIFNKHIHRATPINPVSAPQEAVSKYLRYLFNNKNAFFSGYGSTCVPGNYGPVVYFPLPYHAKKAVDRIFSKVTNANGLLINQLSADPT